MAMQYRRVTCTPDGNIKIRIDGNYPGMSSEHSCFASTDLQSLFGNSSRWRRGVVTSICHQFGRQRWGHRNIHQIVRVSCPMATTGEQVRGIFRVIFAAITTVRSTDYHRRWSEHHSAERHHCRSDRHRGQRRAVVNHSFTMGSEHSDNDFQPRRPAGLHFDSCHICSIWDKSGVSVVRLHYTRRQLRWGYIFVRAAKSLWEMQLNLPQPTNQAAGSYSGRNGPWVALLPLDMCQRKMIVGHK